MKRSLLDLVAGAELAEACPSCRGWKRIRVSDPCRPFGREIPCPECELILEPGQVTWIQDEDGVWREPPFRVGEVAFSEAEMLRELGGDMAEIIDPGRSWWVRLWWRIFPLRMVELESDAQEAIR